MKNLNWGKLIGMILPWSIFCALVSCSDKLPDPITHPRTQLTLSVDWSQVPSQELLPDSILLFVDNDSSFIPAQTNQAFSLHQNSAYTIYGYNRTKYFTINKNQATVNIEEDGNNINGNSGPLYYGSVSTDTLNQQAQMASLKMGQVNRLVNISISISGADLTKIEATLSGVASQVAFSTGTVSGNAIALSEGQISSSTNLIHHVVIPFWLLGISGNSQQLTVTVQDADSSTKSFLYDISSQMNSIFSSNAKTPVTLEGQLNMKYTGSVTNWTIINGKDYDFQK